MPVGFKNGTGGSVQIAVDAVRSSASPHHFLSVTKQGLAAIVATRGNPRCHVILRGGTNGPNYGAEAVNAAAASLAKSGLRPSLMVDCSHANSQKDPSRQPAVARDLGEQIASGSRAIFGTMIESFLVAGRQDVALGKALTYGQSITDACIGWDETRSVLEHLAESVERGRKRR
jgi:3-deoxy-7-phosphoheptulonate synthase